MQTAPYSSPRPITCSTVSQGLPIMQIHERGERLLATLDLMVPTVPANLPAGKLLRFQFATTAFLAARSPATNAPSSSPGESDEVSATAKCSRPLR